MKLKLKENDIQKTMFGKVSLKKVRSSVNFYDYDGTILYSYSKSEFLNLKNLPSLPDRTSENLTCDGWNWTLAEITNYLNTVDGDVNVGTIYHTTDDKTHITCKPTETFPQASINLTPTVANAVTVDWGDGTTDTWTSASQETKSHTYTGVTDSSVYDITISCSSGTYSFDTSITGTLENNKICAYTDIKLSNKVTRLYSSCFYNCYSLQYVAIPDTVTRLGGNCFNNCYSLQYVAIPDTVTSLDTYCFNNCSSLQSITIPSGVTSLDTYCFNNCYSLKSIAISKNIISFGNFCFSGCVSLQTIDIPNSVTSLGNECFRGCSYLQSITIPSSVTSLGDQCFNNCSSLQSITIPSGVTSLSYRCFSDCYSLKTITILGGVTSLGDECFSGCYSLQSIVILDTVTSLGSRCFNSCSSLRKLYMKRTTPTTLSDTNAIPNNANLVIYVPTGTLTAYQTATNWSSFASKIFEED